MISYLLQKQLWMDCADNDTNKARTNFDNNNNNPKPSPNTILSGKISKSIDDANNNILTTGINVDNNNNNDDTISFRM